MQAGKLRSKIDLMKLVVRQDSAGGIINEWQAYGIGVRCDDRVKSTNQKLDAQIEIQEEIHTIKIRYRDDILPSHRVRLSDGRMLNIVGYPQPDPEQKNRFLIITAEYVGD